MRRHTPVIREGRLGGSTRRARVAPVAALLLALAASACGGGGDEETSATATSTTVDEAAATTTTVATTTTPAPTTSAAASTTAAPSTTAAATSTTTTVAPLTAADLDLAPAAIGPVAFGTGVDPALAVLTPLLGPPATDDSTEFPFADEVTGAYLNDADEIFAFPLQRRICFANGLCTSFGGRSTDDLQLVGYDYYTAEAPVEPVLTTVLGLPLGATWGDFPDAMTAQAGGCYSQGVGESGGVQLILISSGELFGTFDGETYTSAVPDPSQVTVYGMVSGENASYLYDDC